MSQWMTGPGGRIRIVFDNVVADGLRRDSVVGATDAAIDAYAAGQGVARVPGAVREVLRLIGARHGLWLAGTAFGVDAVTGETKRQALAALTGLAHALRDPAGMLVLSAHQAYTYQVIDGADLAQEDPPVWEIVEGQDARPRWRSVTAWFAAMDPDIESRREMLEVNAELGHELPAWAADIEPR
ncbi:hypothetical protein D7D52_28270 [Nocardia yunnanensis]|uniref:Uncharacterized protein n=1 Tax=Nocardia yunnanensis TaxID=2382165 RepID=A0A386ZI48_9NOCA|nr:hypothetical protein [Nocardia yunnanensis]AYF77060.1 hypothetical protein D7D52_28270 [Nocardia yunnanensis]